MVPGAQGERPLPKPQATRCAGCRNRKPGGGGVPTGAVAAKIRAAWGSYEKFAEELKTAGATQFGSGWAWLVLDGGQLRIVKTANARQPWRAARV